MKLGQFEVWDNRGEKIIEVMGDSVGELTHRLHLLRLTELLVDGAALGHVARYLGEANQGTAIIVDGIDDHVRPKPRTILAHSPTICLESSVPSRNHQCALRQPVLSIRRRVKHGEMLTNDLLSLIAFDPLCSRILVDPLCSR